MFGACGFVTFVQLGKVVRRHESRVAKPCSLLRFIYQPWVSE